VSFDPYPPAAQAYTPMDLADYECRHGRLSTDTTPPCGCYGPYDRGAHHRQREAVERSLLLADSRSDRRDAPCPRLIPGSQRHA
jgi:hypothetical protein